MNGPFAACDDSRHIRAGRCHARDSGQPEQRPDIIDVVNGFRVARRAPGMTARLRRASDPLIL
ncbi:hypothetical protein D1O30_16840 [Methylocystis hirsuta]|uniref:Uncharacterized protein n=1 Tax=Methylocystis hirsuta TaxID=369798 RepID=A0A3M9XTN7_9HYPH|nr:hypothetical protein D1O30_16840 [Methylocystis hirsuta]